MIAVVAYTKISRAIGFQGQIPWRSPKDFKFFRTITLNSAMIVGKNTLYSLPKLLPHRHHVVVTQNTNNLINSSWVTEQKNRLGEETVCRYLHPVISLTHAKNKAIQIIEQKPELQRFIYVIGGALIYHQLLPDLSYIIATEIDCPIDIQADRYFPKLPTENWHQCERYSTKDDGLGLDFCLYQNQLKPPHDQIYPDLVQLFYSAIRQAEQATNSEN